jgi:hypothetical protein
MESVERFAVWRVLPIAFDPETRNSIASRVLLTGFDALLKSKTQSNDQERENFIF